MRALHKSGATSPVPPPDTRGVAADFWATKAYNLAKAHFNTDKSTLSFERACGEFLGMGPKRYSGCDAWILARRALSRPISPEATVAEVALAHGFWELGRFAVRYRDMFGGSPSATLREPQA